MSDLIKREDAVNAVEMFFKDAYIEDSDVHCADMEYEINRIPAASPWHRVEDGLPKPHEYVLCCGKKGGCFVGWTLDNVDVIKANGHGRAFVHGGNARTFTHWMPLPEPPKEVQE